MSEISVKLNGSNKNMETDSDVSQNEINMTKYKTIWMASTLHGNKKVLESYNVS